MTTTFSPQRSYTGREPDTATGLIYYRARWYDAKLGRFISEDPIGFAAGDANLSRMVGNSTPNHTDPSGLSPSTDAIRGQIARLQREKQYWSSRSAEAERRMNAVLAEGQKIGWYVQGSRQKGFAGSQCINQYGISAYNQYGNQLSRLYQSLAGEMRIAQQAILALDREIARLQAELAASMASENSRPGNIAGPAQEPTDPRWTTKWIHVYDPSGKWLATFEYDESNPDERDLVMAIAKNTQNGVTAEQLGQILHNGIGTGAEVGIRVALDAVDDIASAVEFVQDPTWRNAAGIIPIIPGVIKKCDNLIDGARSLPRLQPIHPLDPKVSKFWESKSTQEILDSLKPGQKESLQAWTDGRILNGHHRLNILEGRGVDIHSLPREIRDPHEALGLPPGID